LTATDPSNDAHRSGRITTTTTTKEN